MSLPRCDKVRTGTFGECAAPLYYEGRVRDALLAFKFKRRIEDLNAYGVLMAEKGGGGLRRPLRCRHLGAGEQTAPEKAWLRPVAYAVRQPVRGLAHGAAGDTA